MANIVTLDPIAHAQLSVAPADGVRLGAGLHYVQLAPRELAHAAMTYPVLVTKDEDSGAFLLGAVLGVEAGENLFLDDMGAGDAYRPLQIQREGFWVADERLAADLDHPRFAGGHGGERLFGADGVPMPFLDGIAEALRELRAATPASAAFLGRLAALRLLAPIDIDLSFDDGTQRTLEDLYAIDQEALRALDDEAALDLFRRGYLQLVYLMVASLKNVPRLAKRKNDRLRG